MENGAEGLSLNPMTQRRLRSLAVYKATGSFKETASRLGISENAVRQHVAWGTAHGMTDTDSMVLVEHRLAELIDRSEKVQRLWEREYERLGRLYTKSEEGNSADDAKLPFRVRDTFVPLTQELRENQVLIMELQGIYKQNANITNVQNNTQIIVLPSKTESTEEWEKMVAMVTNQELSKEQPVIEEAVRQVIPGVSYEIEEEGVF